MGAHANLYLLLDTGSFYMSENLGGGLEGDCMLCKVYSVLGGISSDIRSGI